ncbi:unnamed protein product [Polarella glacialis]|uniref:Uncharacterized protein n=1 Tax=Polarella glacialis TaxID=89957 RepID=A0A813K4S5_POLGL|nr:unnamed protein product [Polarella glacialis]
MFGNNNNNNDNNNNSSNKNNNNNNNNSKTNNSKNTQEQQRSLLPSTESGLSAINLRIGREAAQINCNCTHECKTQSGTNAKTNCAAQGYKDMPAGSDTYTQRRQPARVYTKTMVDNKWKNLGRWAARAPKVDLGLFAKYTENKEQNHNYLGGQVSVFTRPLRPTQGFL